MKKAILIVGGAGYIGSHTALLLAQQGYHTIVLDTLEHGQRGHFPWMNLIRCDMGDGQMLSRLFSMYQFEAVMHFAGHIEVAHSVQQPMRFYDNNVAKSLALLETMLSHQVKTLIYSSSCAVYGAPQEQLLTEDHPRLPTSPYGRSKLAIEHAIEDYVDAYGLKAITLRYFNAAGAWWEHGLGELHQPETHAIPLMIEALRSGTPFTLHGTNYNTSDGSAIRDYVHVRDIAQAHLLALEHLKSSGVCDSFNIGSGVGYSVKQLIHALEKVSGQKLIIKESSPRVGDEPCLVAHTAKAQALLRWQPQHSSLESMLGSALAWHEKVNHSVCSSAIDEHTL